MGNSQSYAKKISMSLDTGAAGSGGRYIAGQKLSGHVNIVASETFQNATDATIYVVFQGVEMTKIRYEKTTGSGDNRKTTVKYAYGKRNICTTQVTLDIEHRVLSAGSYSVPFELTIPEMLPSSMSYESDSNSSHYARVKYQLGFKVPKLFVKNNRIVYDKWLNIKLYAKSHSVEPAPAFAEPDTVPIYSCCCIKKGFISFGSKIDNTVVSEGGLVNVSLGCQNNSTVPLVSVRALIIQKISFKAKHHHKSQSQTLAMTHFSWTEEMKQRNKDSVRVLRERNNDDYAKRGMHNDWNREIYKQITEGTIKSNIKIPVGAMCTWSGSLITISHILVITIDTPGCTTDPSTIFHFRIVPPSFATSANHPASPMHPAPSAPSIADATTYPDGWDTSHVQQVGIVSSNKIAIQYGGAATGGEEDIPLVFATTMPTAPRNISFDGLVEEISDSFDVRNTIRELIKDPEWNQNVFALLSPSHFGKVFSAVNSEFDQPEVAEMMAQANIIFKCAHVVSMLNTVSSFTRVSCVQKTIVSCTDFAENKGSIFNALTDFERICTERDFSR